MSINLPQILVPLLVAGAILCPATRLLADQADNQFAVAAGHYDHGRWKVAVEEFRVFLEKYPRDRRAGESVFFLGKALLQTGQIRQRPPAIHRLRQPRTARRVHPAALFCSGEAAYLAGKFETAKPDLERFLKIYPADRLSAYVLPYLGEIAINRGDVAAGLGYFRDARSRFPKARPQRPPAAARPALRSSTSNTPRPLPCWNP